MKSFTIGDRVIAIGGETGTVVGDGTSLRLLQRTLVRWDSDGGVTEVMAVNLKVLDAPLVR